MEHPLLSCQVRTRRPVLSLPWNCLPGWGILGQSPLVTPTQGWGRPDPLGAEDWSPAETGTQMGRGSHIEMARELVIQMAKALGMECQLTYKVLREATFVSPGDRRSRTRGSHF